MANESVVIYHNARCSKSRSACDIIAALGIEAEVIEYLETPPGKEELRELLDKLDMQPAELVRHGEAMVRDRNVANFALLFRLERRVVQAVFSTRLRAEGGKRVPART